MLIDHSVNMVVGDAKRQCRPVDQSWDPAKQAKDGKRILSRPAARPIALPADEGGPPRAMKRKRRAQGESQETPVAIRERLLREMTQYVTEILIPDGVSVATALRSFEHQRFS